MIPKQVKDITGQTFGRLTAIRYSRSVRSKSGATAYWWCSCTCGIGVEVAGSSLRNGNTTSCGCYAVERVTQRNRRHGAAVRGKKTPEYVCWRNMLARCYSRKATRYELYGGRGIAVCDRWRSGEDGMNGFECFFEDMGPRPTPEHSIDRRDNDLNYDKENCRWVLHVIQVRNSRHNTLLETPAGMMPMSAAAELFEADYGRLRSRVRMGWDHTKAVTAPTAGPTLVVRGEPMTLLEAAGIGAVSEAGIRKRLKRGWSAEDAVFQPKQKTGPKPRSPSMPPTP